MKTNRLIIGIDYGTTFTGVSFCEVTSADLKSQDVEVIHDWPSRFTRIGTREKVPSEISYQAEGLAWGASIAPDVPRHMWTKLQLDSAAGGEAAKIQQESARFDKSKQKEPVQIIADFLAQAKIHLMKNLDQKYGKTLWRSLPIYLVVTVPAVWSDLAKARTLQAVDRAGFNSQGTEFPKLEKTVIATEPEAAAIYTINSMRQSVYDNNLKVGDGFIMCDMGGGTVDLISYKVAKLEPTRVEEITVGSGNQCGGSFVDRAFLQWLERRLGTPDFIEIAGCRSEQVPRINLNRKAARMLQDFIQEIKCGFDGTQTNSLRLPKPLKDLEDDEERGIEDGELGITAEDTIGMFNEPLLKTILLLTEQIELAQQSKTKLKYVFMVGGFSESPYMFKQLEDFIKKHKLEAIRPSYAWSAVVRGAVIKGLEGGSAAITKRKCRRFYGTSCSQIFRPGVHDESDSYIDEYDGRKRAMGQMEWLLKKGQDLDTSEASHAELDLAAHFWPHETTRIAVSRLLVYNGDEAPASSDSNGVETLNKLQVDLSDVPKRVWRSRRSPSGDSYQELNFTVKISLQERLEFSLLIKGKKYGMVVATYE